jgi:hypothetical protein
MLTEESQNASRGGNALVARRGMFLVVGAGKAAQADYQIR